MANLKGGTTIGGYEVLHGGNYSIYAATTTHTHNLVKHNLTAPALIDGVTTSNFRTSVFGSNTYGYQISTARWNNLPSLLTGQGMGSYGTMIAWAGDDTHAFLAVNYNNAVAKIGGGSADTIAWTKNLAFGDGTGASGSWGINITGAANNAGWSSQAYTLYDTYRGGWYDGENFFSINGYITSYGDGTGYSRKNGLYTFDANTGGNIYNAVSYEYATEGMSLQINNKNNSANAYTVLTFPYDSNFKNLGIDNIPVMYISKSSTSFPFATYHEVIHTGNFSRLVSNNNLIYRSASATETGIVNLTSLQQLGGGDKLINGVRIGKGTNSVVTNMVVGSGLSAVTTANYNTVAGINAGDAISTGAGNTLVGKEAGKLISTGGQNTIVGVGCGNALVGGNNNVLIGAWTQFQGPSDTNSIIIGYIATGRGSNTVSIGNSSITANYFSGDIINTAGLTIGTAGARTSNLAIANAIAIGDGDTGWRQNGDGVLETYANNALCAIQTSASNNFYKTVNGIGVDVVAYASSDRRLKDNIIPITNPLEKISKLGGYTFDWNDKQTTYSGHDIGVIAQEVEEVLPEIVETRDNGYKAVKYEKMVALLIEGIKEQQIQINELKEEITQLKIQINGTT